MKLFCPVIQNPSVKKTFAALSAALGRTRAYEFYQLNNGYDYHHDYEGNEIEVPDDENELQKHLRARYDELVARSQYGEIVDTLSEQQQTQNTKSVAGNRKNKNVNQFNVAAVDKDRVDVKETVDPNEHEGNKTLKIYLKGHPEKGQFELVKDREFGQYSVYLKTDKSKLEKGDTKVLFEELSKAIPDGAIVSTWGSLTEDGIRVLNENIGRGMTKVGERTATLKSNGSQIKIPVYQKGDATILQEQKNKAVRNQKINFVNLLHTAINNSGKPIYYLNGSQLESVIKKALDRKTFIKVIAHNGNVLGCITNGIAYVNLNNISAYSQMYLYTHLWAYDMYTSKKLQPVWDSICNFIDMANSSDSILTAGEQKLMNDVKAAAMRVFHINKPPKRSGTNHAYNMYVAEIISILSGNNTHLLFSELHENLNAETTRLNKSKFLTAMRSIATMLKEFWNTVYNFFANALNGPKIETVYQLAHMSFGDLSERLKLQYRNVAMQNEINSKKFTDEQTSEIEKTFEDVVSDNVVTMDLASNVFRELTFQKEYPKEFLENKLYNDYMNDSSITSEQKTSIIKHFQNCIVELLIGMCNLDFVDDYFDRYEFLDEDMKTKITNIVNQNPFDPFTDIIKTVGFAKLKQQIVNNVVNDIADLNLDVDVIRALIDNVTTYADMYMFENDNFLKATLSNKFKFNFQTRSYDESEENVDDNLNDSNSQDENDTDDEVNEFLQIDQLHVNFVRSVDGIIKLYLSQFQDFSAGDMFGTSNYNHNEIITVLASLCHDCENVQDLKQRILNSKLPYSVQLVETLEQNDIFANKLLSNLQKTRNSYSLYRTQLDATFRVLGLDVEHHVQNEAAQQAIQYNVGSSDESLFYIGDDNHVHVSITQIEHLRNHIYDLANNWKALVSNVPFTKVSRRGKEILATNDSNAFDLALYSFIGNLNDKLSDNTIMGLLNHLGFGNMFYTSIYRCLSQPCSDHNYKRSTEHIIKFLNDFDKGLNELVKKVNNTDSPYNTVDQLLHSQKGIIRHMIQLTGNLLSFTDTIYKASVHGGINKPFSVFTPTNYVHRVVSELNKPANLQNDEQNTRTRIMNDLFNKIILDTRDSKFTSDIVQLAMQSKYGDVELYTTTSFDNRKYSEFNELQYLAYAVANWERDRYILPVLADKTTHYSIRGLSKDLGEFNKGVYTNTKLTQKMFVTFMQELARMRHDRMLGYNYTGDNTSDTISFGKCIQFVFLPQFNKILRNINDLNNGKLTKTEQQIGNVVRNYILCKTNVIPVETSALIKNQIENYLNNQCEKFRNTLQETCEFVSKYGRTFDNEIPATVAKLSDLCNNKLQFYNFYWTYAYALNQMYQLLNSDLVFYKNPTDTVKRSAQGISPGIHQNYNRNSLYKQGLNKDGSSKFDDNMKRVVMLNDEKHSTEVTNPTIITELEKLKKSFAQQVTSQTDDSGNSIFTKQEIEKLIDENNEYIDSCIQFYKDYDATDGQGVVSIDYVGRMLNSLGRDSKFRHFYKKFVQILDHYDPTLTGEQAVQNKKECLYGTSEMTGAVELQSNNRFIQETIKQFTYVMHLRDAKIDNYKINEPFQVKNAEFPLLDLVSMLNNEDDTQLQLCKMMREEGIDAIYFASNLKVCKPQKAALTGQLSDYNGNTDQLVADIKSSVNKNYHDVVMEVPIESVVLQQETPSHFNNFKIILGNQIMKLFSNSLNDTETLNINGYTVTGETAKQMFWNALAEKVKRQKQSEMSDILTYNATKNQTQSVKDNIEQNIKLSRYLRKIVNSNDQSDSDFLKAVSLGNDGNLILNPNDPLIFGELQKIVVNTIKRVASRIKVPGMHIVQVTDALSSILSTPEYTVSNSKSNKRLRVVYRTDSQGRKTGIDYFEARVPIYHPFIKQYVGENGMVDIDKIKADGNEHLLELVAYRIPTEGYCSMIPIKVVGFTNDVTGGIIQLPDEVTSIMGVDFDIDKLFVLTPHLTKDNGKYVFKVPEDTIDNASEAAIDNRILSIIYQTLRSKSVFKDYLIPSNYFKLKRQSRIYALINARLRENLTENNGALLDVKKYYDELNKLSSAELEERFKKLETDTDLCLIDTQMSMHNRNYSGKQILSIAASTSTVHSMARNWNVKVNVASPFTLCGHYIGKYTPIDTKMTFNNVTEVQETIRQILTASPDTAKDPVFQDLNITTFSIRMFTVLARFGFTLEQISAFFSQPIVKKIVQMTEFDTSEYNASTTIWFDRYFKDMVKQARRISTDPELFSTITVADESGNETIEHRFLFNPLDDITLDMLKDNMNRTLPDTVTQSDLQFLKQQYAVYKVIKSLLRLSTSLMFIKDIVNQNNQTDSSYTDIFQLQIKQNKLQRKIEACDNGITIFNPGLAGVFQKGHRNYNPFIATCYETRNELLSEYLSKLLPSFNAFMHTVLPKFTSSDLVASNSYWQLYNQWNTYCLFNIIHGGKDGYFDKNPDTIVYYRNYFPTIAAKKTIRLLESDNYKNNTFLQHLKFDSNGISVRTNDLTADERAGIKRDWALLLMQDDDAAKFAKNLFVYALYKDGFNFKSNTLTRLAPVEIKNAITNYKMFLDKMSNMPALQVDALANEFYALTKSNINGTGLGGNGFHRMYRENISTQSTAVKALQEMDTAEETEIEIAIPLRNVAFDKTQFFNVKITDKMLQQGEEATQNICRI